MDLPVVLSKTQAGTYVAEVTVIPGCVAEAATMEEAVAKVKQAAEAFLQDSEEESWFVPEAIEEDEIDAEAALAEAEADGLGAEMPSLQATADDALAGMRATAQAYVQDIEDESWLVPEAFENDDIDAEAAMDDEDMDVS